MTRGQVCKSTFDGVRSAFAAPVRFADLTPVWAAVWFIHGAYNKLLHGSPRHLAIVQSVPGLSGRRGEWMLLAVGLLEVMLGVWMLSRRAPRSAAAMQTCVLLTMNAIELTFARDLLVWPGALLPINVCFLALVWASALDTHLRRSGPVEVRNVDLTLRGLRGVGGPGLRTRLRRHPLAIRATLRDCLTLTYALPAAALRPLLPPGLELETIGDTGFVAVALVQTERLRPDGVPARLGRDFFLAGYRVFTRFRAADGRVLRGLRILRSDTDRTLMALGGNLLTHYNYHRCRATVVSANETLRVAVRTEDGVGDLDVIVERAPAALPDGSPFASIREARHFAGPLPFTFDYEPETHAIVAIEARRTNWRPMPVSADVHRLSFFDQPAFAGCAAKLAAAFYVRDIDYHWRRGVRHAL